MSMKRQQPEQPQSAQPKYRVVIEQTMFSTVVIEAASQEEAEERACEDYTDPDFDLWDVSFGQFSVNECELTSSDTASASCACEQVRP
jgi:hypothetical protein